MYQPYIILRRMAPRVAALLLRHKDEMPCIAALEPDALELCSSFIHAYDEFAVTQETRDVVTDGLGPLALEVRRWSNVAGVYIPGVEQAQFGEHPRVPEHVFADAEQLIDLLDRHEAQHGLLPFGVTMREHLSGALASARQVHGSVGGGIITRADLQRELQAKAKALRRMISTVRRALALELGPTHPAVRSLRVQSRRADAGDEPPIDSEPNSPGDSVGSGEAAR